MRPRLQTRIGSWRARTPGSPAEHLAGEIDADPRQRLPQPLAYPPFVCVVEEREQKRHRDGVKPGFADRADHRIDVGLVDRSSHVPLRIDALGDLVTSAARHQHALGSSVTSAGAIIALAIAVACAAPRLPG